MRMKDCAARAPASLLSIVMGLTGLGSAWRLAHEVWHLPSAVGEVILTAATAIWLTLLLMYGIKWLLARDEALRELKHPVQSCFVAFVPLSTILIAATMQPYLGEAAFGLFLTGAGASLCYALYHVGRLSLGGQDPEIGRAHV